MSTILNSGDILKSRYQILHQIGHGGFGRTYLAEDINRFNEPCVLKEFAPQLQGSFALSKAQELFEREAGVLYRLKHPQIPRFRELFRYKHQGKGRLFLVQDYIEGQTYHTLINNRSKKGLKFSEAEICQLLGQILPVLAYIHSMGVIHRDISPDNLILRSTDGLAVLIDFGSIKEVATKAKSQLIDKIIPFKSQTQERIPDFQLGSETDNIPLIGTVLGKSGYAPPEQMERGIVRPHSDLYALAATAVVLLTGKEPGKLITPYSYQWRWQEEITLSPHLEWVLTKMLAPHPGDRFVSASEVKKALENSSVSIANIQPETNKLPVKRMASIFRLSSKIPWLITLAVLVVLGGGWWWQKRELATVNPIISDVPDSTQVKSQLQERFSQGEKVLITQTNTPEKELAAAAFAKGHYLDSISLFIKSLEIRPNDPEALIYLNNAQIGQQNSYSIAVSVPIGFDVHASQEILRGVAQAQTLVNQKGGIDGIPLKVQIINDDNNPEIARQIAIALGQKPEILGVVGHYASDVTLATAQIYQSGQLVVISPISTSVKLSDLSPYLFRTVPSDYIAARALGEYMLQELGQQNVAVFYSSQSNYSESLKSEFIAAVSLGGGRIVSTFDLSDANFNATESLQQAMDRGANVLMLAANTGTLDKALQVIQVNRQQLSLLGGDDVYTPKTLQVAGELGQGMVLAIPWHIDRKPEAEFTQIARQLWGGDVNWRTAMAYDATSALIAAIERSPTRLGVQQTLSHPDFSAFGACNEIYFLPSGDRAIPIELVKIQKSDRTPFGYEFTPIISQIE